MKVFTEIFSQKDKRKIVNFLSQTYNKSISRGVKSNLAFSKLPSSNSEVRCALLNCINKLQGINRKQQILDNLDSIINK